MSQPTRTRRVLHVIRTLDPAFGGPPVVCTQLARAQTARGHAVEILTSDANQTWNSEAGVLVSSSLPPSLIDLFVRGRTRRALAEHIARADVLHLHGVWDPILLGAAAEARRAQVPYFVMPHGMLDPWSLSQKRWKKKLALALGVRRYLDQAVSLHLLNSDEARLIARLRLRTEACVVPNGVDLGAIEPLPDPRSFREAFPEVGHDPYVLFLSRLHYKKGLDILADAFALVAARNTHVKLVVAGPDGGEQQAFSRQIAGHGLAHRVVLTGPIFGKAKWAALAGAACFCLPSRQEGFSVAILEALACRIPAVITEQCHFPEVGECGAGIVAKLSAGAIAEGVIRVLAAEPKNRAEMGRAGRRLVDLHYTWDKVAESCARMYDAAGRGNSAGSC